MGTVSTMNGKAAPGEDRRGLSDEVKDEVVRLYEQGTKLNEITKQTGVKRPTIFYILQSRGVTPSRQRDTKTEVRVEVVLAQLSATQRELGRMEAELERLQAENTKLRERLRAARRKT